VTGTDRPEDRVPVALPDPQSRWRCASCGNLTRFDVRRTRQTLEYWHLDLAGDVTIGETEVLAETLEQVRCRWCDAVDSVELVPRPAGSGEPAAR
jgi:hypothetical protein